MCGAHEPVPRHQENRWPHKLAAQVVTQMPQGPPANSKGSSKSCSFPPPSLIDAPSATSGHGSSDGGGSRATEPAAGTSGAPDLSDTCPALHPAHVAALPPGGNAALLVRRVTMPCHTACCGACCAAACKPLTAVVDGSAPSDQSRNHGPDP